MYGGRGRSLHRFLCVLNIIPVPRVASLTLLPSHCSASSKKNLRTKLTDELGCSSVAPRIKSLAVFETSYWEPLSESKDLPLR